MSTINCLIQNSLAQLPDWLVENVSASTSLSILTMSRFCDYVCGGYIYVITKP